MKFTLTGVSAALALSSIASAYIIPRDVTPEQNETLSQYPNTTDFGSLNGTWYLTGITQSAYTIYQSLTQSAGFDIDCLQFNLTASSNTTLDVIGSGFLNKTDSAIGVNATAAGVLLLQDPDSSTNTSDHQYVWDAYGSQIFVNKAQWDNFTSNGQSSANASDSGSTTISGSKPFQLSLYTKFLDSNAQPGSNDSTNFDTIFIWGSQVKFFEQNQYKKRAEDIYGLILSKTSSLDDDKFNKTVALLPQPVATNNVTIVKLNDTCHSS